MTTTIESKNALQSILKNSAVIITLTTALLYFHGRAFYSGYISYWGLSEGLFPLSTENALTHGVLVYIILLAENISIFGWVLGYVVLIYLLAYFLLCDGPRRFVQRWFKKRESKSKQSPHSEFQKSAVTIFFNTCVAVSIILIFLGITSKARSNGSALSEEYHQKVLSGKLDTKPFEKAIITYLDAANKIITIEGFILNVSSSHSAFYTQGEVIILSQDRIVTIRLPENKE